MTQPSLATILNVNDSEATRYMASRILEMAGYHVVEAATGLEGLRLATELRPDVVILDIKLPDIDGFEVCARLRANEATSSIAVMQTSATYTTPSKRVQGLDSGADAYLVQPFEASELLATVRSLIRLRHAEQESRKRAAMLEEADRRKDEFLAMLAHELRNPLAAILTATGILDREDNPNPKDARMRTIIHRQTTHLARLVDDLLDVSRITRGKIELRRAPQNLNELLERVVAVAQPHAEGRKLKLEADVGGAPVRVSGDATRLEQIFSNLVDNAVKYSDAGGQIRVSLSVRGVDGSAEAVVRVRDTGIGIPPESREKIFDLFAQVDESLDRTRGGLGIGLTLVRQLVHLHGGSVEVESDGLGQGSEFIVCLPVLKATLEHVALASPAQRAERRARRILLVEDNPDARQSMQDLLELWGHQVAVAHDGTSGIATALAAPPEVAVVDIGLPGADGYQVASELRAQLGRNVHLIALTGYGGADGERRTRQAGFDIHLTKPVRPDELARVLNGLE